MLAYTTLGASDLEAAVEFYGALTETMGWKKITGTDRIVFFGSSMSEACLAVCTPYDEQTPTSGNGVMVAFYGGSKEGVDALYAHPDIQLVGVAATLAMAAMLIVR